MTNTITITGRLSADPEIRFASTGTAMCTVTVPDQKRALNRDTNEWEDKSATTWFKATVFKEAAEALAERAKKGDTVTVTGRLITREWTSKEGEVRSSLEVDFATVAVVPALPKSDRRAQPQGQQDPWAAQAEQGKAQTTPYQQPGGWGQHASESPF